MFKKTTAQSKIGRLRKRIRIIQGGSSSSKTFSIIPLLITYAVDNPKAEISIVSESIPHLRRGVIRDFIKIMDWTDNFNANNWNKSNHTYTFSNGSFIEFFSVDQPDKLRGARRDVLFINEANNISFEAYQQLSIRTKKFIYLDFNPTSEFWAHTELMNDRDSDFIVLTYKDNEALDKSIVQEIEKARDKAEVSSYWANWWRVYGLGEIGNLEGVIFGNWKQINNIPSEAKYLCTGLDFGFTNDPTAVVDIYKYNDSIIVDEVLYQSGLTNNEIHKALYDKMRLIVADSAEPKSIEEIRRMGSKIIGATKGKDSILHSIQLIQQHELLVTANSTNLIKELRGYVWLKDKSGKSLNEPIDYLNHGIDALRYAFIHAFGSKTTKKYLVR